MEPANKKPRKTGLSTKDHQKEKQRLKGLLGKQKDVVDVITYRKVQKELANTLRYSLRYSDNATATRFRNLE